MTNFKFDETTLRSSSGNVIGKVDRRNIRNVYGSAIAKTSDILKMLLVLDKEQLPLLYGGSFADKDFGK